MVFIVQESKQKVTKFDLFCKMAANLPSVSRHLNIMKNTPIQIYWKSYNHKKKKKKKKNADKKSDIVHISAQNIDCGYSLEPPRHNLRFLSRNKKNNV